MKLTYSTAASYDVVEAGMYPAQLEGVTDGTGEYGEYLRFQWILLDDDGGLSDTSVSGLCNPILNSRSKLSQWVQAHLGGPLAAGQEVDLEDLPGKRVVLTITVEPRPDGQGDRNRITAVSPMRKAQPTRVVSPTNLRRASVATEEIPF